MYIEVHKEGNKWFRNDGTLVGTAVKTTSYLNSFEHVIKGTNDQYYRVVRGKIDENGIFVPACSDGICTPGECPMKNTPICFLYKNPGNNYIYSDN